MNGRNLARRYAAIAAGLLGVVVVAGCSGGQSAGQATATTGAQDGRVALSQTLEHVHGAGFDTTTGEVIAGTHHGAWKISPGGDVSSAGPAQDDFMGFTISGPSRWYASGHPGPGSPAKNPLGLITSTDKGASWSAVSLSGEVDFHALAVSGETVAGFDPVAGLTISLDSGATWKQGTHLRPAALVFAGSSLLASTEQGLLASTDSGATFNPVVGAPPAVLLSAAGNTVWCVDVNGDAWSSPDAGVTWTKQESVGEVSAIAAVDATTAYVLTPTDLIKVS